MKKATYRVVIECLWRGRSRRVRTYVEYARTDAMASSPLHDDQLDADDMSSIGMFLLSRRESGATIDDPEDLFPVYGMDDVYGIHSGTPPCPAERSHVKMSSHGSSIAMH
eukprot:COSAG02_NODE_11170_length_1777_cov_36.646603_2_plen_110_part_00